MDLCPVAVWVTYIFVVFDSFSWFLKLYPLRKAQALAKIRSVLSALLSRSISSRSRSPNRGRSVWRRFEAKYRCFCSPKSDLTCWSRNEPFYEEEPLIPMFRWRKARPYKGTNKRSGKVKAVIDNQTDIGLTAAWRAWPKGMRVAKLVTHTKKEQRATLYTMANNWQEVMRIVPDIWDKRNARNCDKMNQKLLGRTIKFGPRVQTHKEKTQEMVSSIIKEEKIDKMLQRIARFDAKK